MNNMLFFKSIFLFITLWWWSVNIVKTIYRTTVPKWNFILASFGLTGLIALTFWWV